MERLNGKKAFRAFVESLKIKLIDAYIIRKFLGTFFFCLVLILTIAVVFDFAEKIDNFMEKQAPVQAIIFSYYMNFIPYFATLFAPLFVFISVIFFTSKMAVNTEIIAILNSGMSFRRLMWPYFLSALVIASFTFVLTNFVIPKSNLIRMDFEDKYYRSSSRKVTVENIHRQVFKNILVYMQSYNPLSQRGQNFTIEKFNDSGRLESKLSSSSVIYDTVAHKWTAINYFIREIKGNEEIITKGGQIDTTLTIQPTDFSRDPGFVGTMTYRELYDYINLLRLQGSDELKLFLIEKHRRFANPFAVFILTLIGVSLSSQFSLKGSLGPMLAMWIPNILYSIIALVLYKMAPK
jgi:lipopolysaccharide export system permease protein